MWLGLYSREQMSITFFCAIIARTTVFVSSWGEKIFVSQRDVNWVPSVSTCCLVHGSIFTVHTALFFACIIWNKDQIVFNFCKTCILKINVKTKMTVKCICDWLNLSQVIVIWRFCCLKGWYFHLWLHNIIKYNSCFCYKHSDLNCKCFSTVTQCEAE